MRHATVHLSLQIFQASSTLYTSIIIYIRHVELMYKYKYRPTIYFTSLPLPLSLFFTYTMQPTAASKSRKSTVTRCGDCGGNCRTGKCDAKTERRRKETKKPVIIMMDDTKKEQPDIMWTLDKNKNPVQKVVPQPQGCLQRKVKRRRNHVQFDKAWVYHFSEHGQGQQGRNQSWVHSNYCYDI